MRFVLFLVLLVVVVLGHRGKRDNKCIYQATDGSFYNLGRLNKREGKPYSYLDESGDEWVFNVCGDLKGLEAPNCPADSVVCKRSQLLGANAGKRASWGDSVHGPAMGVEIIYGEGDSCNNGTQRKTTFEFVCPNITAPSGQEPPHPTPQTKPEDASDDSSEDNTQAQLVIKSVVQVDSCYTVITVESRSACPIPVSVMIGHQRIMRINAAFLVLALLVCLSSCVLICCCVRRRRQRKMVESKMLHMNTFQQIPQFNVQGSAPLAPQYFYYPVQAPMVEKESLLSADEKYARELQQQFNNENL